METYILKKSNRKGKRFVIIMEEKGHKHHFGAIPFKNGTFIEHKKDKNFNNKHSGIYYSRFLLWGDHTDLKKNIKDLEKKDKVKIKIEL